MIKTELSVLSILLGGFALWVFGTFAVCLLRSLSWQRQMRLSKGLQPQIREVMLHYLAGNEDRSKLREFVRISQPDTAEAVMSFQSAVAGSARDRLCELALDLALVHNWCQDTQTGNPVQRRTAFSRLSFICSYEPCRRVAGEHLLRALKDPDDEIRLSACRALVQSAAVSEVERVFEHTVSQNLLFRILLTEELRRHAASLCRGAIPRVLKSGDPSRILAVLQMVAAWERAVPMTGVGRLLQMEDRSVRLQALKVVSLVPDDPDIRKGILDALADPDSEIAVQAALAAGRLRLEASLPALARCLRAGEPDLARAAAAALSEMPERGWITLEELSSSPNQATALAAREALARVRSTP